MSLEEIFDKKVQGGSWLLKDGRWEVGGGKKEGRKERR